MELALKLASSVWTRKGYFDVGAPFGPMTVTCTATLKTAGSYAPSWSMVDVISTTPLNERTVQTGTGSMVAYTKPTIVPTFPTPIYARRTCDWCP
jgi:hypothetical protein